jgi:hypothetical protein
MAGETYEAVTSAFLCLMHNFATLTCIGAGRRLGNFQISMCAQREERENAPQHDVGARDEVAQGLL